MKQYYFTESKSSIWLSKLETLLNTLENRDNATGHTGQKKMMECGQLLLKHLNNSKQPGVFCAIEVLNVQQLAQYAGPSLTLNTWKEILDTVEKVIPTDAYIAKVNLGIAMHLWGEKNINNIQTILEAIASKLENFNLEISFENRPIVLSLNSHIGYISYPVDTGYLNDYRLLSRYAALSTIAKDDLNMHSETFIRRYDKKFHQHITEKISTETILMRMIHEKTFTLEFQPQINLNTGKVFGAESLARWDDKDLPPHMNVGDYIQIIEKTPLVIDFTIVSFTLLIEFLTKNHKKLPKNFKMSFNVSRVLFKWKSFDIYEALTALLTNKLYLLHYIELEITESGYLSPAHYERILDAMTKFHNFGFSLAIDDFGSGYSSLRMLTSNIPNVIKLDKYITQHLSDNSTNTLFIQNLIFSALHTKFDIIAEGVETEEEEKKLRQLGVHLVQGYKYSKSLKEKDFLNFIETYQITLKPLL